MWLFLTMRWRLYERRISNWPQGFHRTKRNQKLDWVPAEILSWCVFSLPVLLFIHSIRAHISHLPSLFVQKAKALIPHTEYGDSQLITIGKGVNVSDQSACIIHEHGKLSSVIPPFHWNFWLPLRFAKLKVFQIRIFSYSSWTEQKLTLHPTGWCRRRHYSPLPLPASPPLPGCGEVTWQQSRLALPYHQGCLSLRCPPRSALVPAWRESECRRRQNSARSRSQIGSSWLLWRSWLWNDW